MASLQQTAIKSVSELLSHKEPVLEGIPPNIQIDILQYLYREERYSLLSHYVKEWFLPLLSFGKKRTLLHRIFEKTKQTEEERLSMEELLCTKIDNELQSYIDNCVKNEDCYGGSLPPPDDAYRSAECALNFAVFLCDSGWYKNSSRILRSLQSFVHLIDDLVEEKIVCKSGLTHSDKLLTIQKRFKEFQVYTLTYLLYNNTETCDMEKCERYFKLLKNELEKNHHSDNKEMQVAAFTVISSYYLMKSLYEDALHYALKAVKLIPQAYVSPKTTIDALLQTSQALIMKSDLKLARKFILASMQECKVVFGENHLKYADCLMNFSHLLELNGEEIDKSIEVIQEALEIRKSILGSKFDNNLKIAKCHEELAYNLYTKDYITDGVFLEALHHCMRSYVIREKWTKTHTDSPILMTTPLRYLALIVEEIIVDARDDPLDFKLLKFTGLVEFFESKYLYSNCPILSSITWFKKNDMLFDITTALYWCEKIHRDALDLYIQVYGEEHYMTAICYSNLGRVHQSIKSPSNFYIQATHFHEESIKIHTKLFGKNDHKTARCYGHLASLLTYNIEGKTKQIDMLRSYNVFKRAESLFLKTIKIYKSQFGDQSKGLDYFYRGLMHLYCEKNWPLYNHYLSEFYHWRFMQIPLLPVNEDNKEKSTNEEPPAVVLDCLIAELNNVVRCRDYEHLYDLFNTTQS